MSAAAQPLIESLRNLEIGYDRRYALCYLNNEVWEALQAVSDYLDVSDPLVHKALLTAEDHRRYEQAEARLRAAFGRPARAAGDPE